MNKKEMKRFFLYLLRWQMSTPLLAICMSILDLPTIWKTIVANLMGGIIFFWIDKFIFKERK
ncbi:MAG: hypothetical protein J6T10_24265 [Methanobrevibacter sp.]|nr:hypothetical protein [Methanobrevibacter sp.]